MPPAERPAPSPCRVTFLGTGTSHGIPMINCDCRACTSSDSRDRRTRSSVLIELPGGTAVVDTAPEFRLQCIACAVRRIDAVLFTHAHADHIAGLDDIRRFSAAQETIIPCYGDRGTLETVCRAFGYAFRETDQDYSERPRLRAVPIDGEFDLLGARVLPLELWHGRDKVLGFRVGSLAYCTDCSDIPVQTQVRLAGLDVLILDALRYTPHPTHFSLDQAVEAAKRIGARRTYFTHIAHEIVHADLAGRLPPGIELAWDGLRIAVSPIGPTQPGRAS